LLWGELIQKVDPVISTTDLTKFYGKDLGIIDLHLEVYEGEIFGFLGPNGAGKTTAIRLLLDFIRPTQGSAQIFGFDSRKDGIKIKKRVGYLPGELELYHHLTGEELLIFMAHLRHGVDWDLVDSLVKRLKADIQRPIGSLSHGNKQKIGLIQAFMHKPDLLILDEPTMGLDPLIQQEFHKMVGEVKKDGRTVFLSSHIMPEVEQICDRVGIIREGRLIALEKMEDLKARRMQSLEIHFATNVPSDAFEDIPGVVEVTVRGKVLHCKVSGSLDPFIKAIAQYRVVNLICHETSLEEIFLSYYGGDEK
jgi:ABC-2 type transport system ATP-binding protein